MGGRYPTPRMGKAGVKCSIAISNSALLLIMIIIIISPTESSLKYQLTLVS